MAPEATARIDWRRAFFVYMQHVGEAEGIDFLDNEIVRVGFAERLGLTGDEMEGFLRDLREFHEGRFDGNPARD